MNNKYLTGDQVIDIVRTLAKEHGFYSRILHTIESWEANDTEYYEAFKKGVEAQQFKDPTDVVMFFEI